MFITRICDKFIFKSLHARVLPPQNLIRRLFICWFELCTIFVVSIGALHFVIVRANSSNLSRNAISVAADTCSFDLGRGCLLAFNKCMWLMLLVLIHVVGVSNKFI